MDIVRRNHHKENDEHISTILKENNITFLASNVAGHILERKDMAPNAYALLQGLGGVLYRARHKVLSGHPADDGGDDNFFHDDAPAVRALNPAGEGGTTPSPASYSPTSSAMGYASSRTRTGPSTWRTTRRSRWESWQGS